MLWIVIEILAAVTGIIYVFLEVKKTRKMWYWMIVSSILNGIAFVHKGFLSMTVIQIYYIVTAVYGIAKWTKVVDAAVEQYGYEDPKTRKSVAIVRPDSKKIAVSSAIALVLFAVMSFISMHSSAPSAGDIPGKPYWDAGIAVLSMLATYWLTQSYYAQWYVWLVVNITGIVVFLFPVFTGHSESAMIPIGLTYVIYLVNNIRGIINWRKHGVIVDNV